MYSRLACFVMLLLLGFGVGFAAEARKHPKPINLVANLSYVINNSSDETIVISALSKKKKGQADTEVRLVTVKPYGVEQSKSAIYYYVNDNVGHVSIFVDVNRKTVAQKSFEFNTLPRNGTTNPYINPAKEKIDVFVYKSNGNWTAFWQVLPGT